MIECGKNDSPEHRLQRFLWAWAKPSTVLNLGWFNAACTSRGMLMHKSLILVGLILEEIMLLWNSIEINVAMLLIGESDWLPIRLALLWKRPSVSKVSPMISLMYNYACVLAFRNNNDSTVFFRTASSWRLEEINRDYAVVGFYLRRFRLQFVQFFERRHLYWSTIPNSLDLGFKISPAEETRCPKLEQRAENNRRMALV